MYDIKSKQLNGDTYFSTLSIYKYIGLSSHQKLKEKAIKSGLEIIEIDQVGSALNKPDLVNLLQTYLTTLKDDKLIKVNRLIQGLTEVQLKLEPNQPKDLPMVKPSGSILNPNNPNQEAAVKQVNQPHRWYERSLSELTRIIKAISTFFKSEQFVFVVLSGALLIQVNHIASLFIYVSVNQDSLAWLTAYLFGTVSELTALLLTIHKGNRNILRAFAILTFWVNLLYYQVWLGYDGSSIWLTRFLSQVTLSGLLAYVIYTYAHLFTMDLFKE